MTRKHIVAFQDGGSSHSGCPKLELVSSGIEHIEKTEFMDRTHGSVKCGIKDEVIVI